MNGKEDAAAALARVRAESERVKAMAALNEVQKMSEVKAREGTVPLDGVFIGSLPAKSKNTAAAGQQGGGGAGSHAPPVTMQIIASVSSLTSVHIPDAEYRIVSPTKIEFPARDDRAMKAARDALKVAKQAANDAKAKNAYAADPAVVKMAAANLERVEKNLKESRDRGDELEEVERWEHMVEAAKLDLEDRRFPEVAALRVAEANLEASKTVVSWMPVEEGQTIYVKTFSEAAAKSLKPLECVQLAGVYASYSVYEGRVRLELSCAEPVSKGSSSYSPYVTLSRTMDLHQIPVCIPDPGVMRKSSMILLFATYNRSPEDAAAGRGNVVRTFLGNSENPDDYKYVRQKEEDKLSAVWRMAQEQDNSLAGYPAGHYSITSKFTENGWAHDQQGTRNILRTGFGINTAATFAPILAANPVPAIIACSLNQPETAKANAGRDHRRDAGTLITYGNAAYFCLREYLLQQAPQVSLKWVKQYFGLNPEEPVVYLQNENPDRPCMLNRHNFTAKGGKVAFTGNRVINVSEFTGNITALIASSQNVPCEFRVLHSALTDEQTRYQLAHLPVEEAERVLNGEMGAKIRLQGQGIIKVIYLVQTMDAAELQAYQEAEDAWKERIMRQKAAIHDAVIASQSDANVEHDMGDDKYDDGEDPNKASDAMLRRQQQEEEDEEVLRQQLEEEEAAAISASAKKTTTKKREPSVEVSAHEEEERVLVRDNDGDDDDENVPAKRVAKKPKDPTPAPAGSGKKTTVTKKVIKKRPKVAAASGETADN